MHETYILAAHATRHENDKSQSGILQLKLTANGVLSFRIFLQKITKSDIPRPAFRDNFVSTTETGWKTGLIVDGGILAYYEACRP